MEAMYNIIIGIDLRDLWEGISFMEELQLKYVEIVFDKQTPQNVGIEINISSEIDSKIGDLEYKFIVGRGGIWKTIQEFSEKNECTWKPKREGEYMVMVQAREKYGKKPLDYLAREDYSIIAGEEINAMHEEVSIEKVVNEGNIKMDFKDIVENENSIEIEKEDSIDSKIELKKAINNAEDNVVFLDIKELSKDEKEILAGDYKVNAETTEIIHETIIEKSDVALTVESGNSIEREVSIIKDIIIDKEEIIVGEKCSIEVKARDENRYLYRFYIKRYKDWDIVRDYDTSNILKYTATEAGEKEFLIQCKEMESVENFNEYKTIKVTVKNICKIEITNFKCLSKSLIVEKILNL